MDSQTTFYSTAPLNARTLSAEESQDGEYLQHLPRRSRCKEVRRGRATKLQERASRRLILAEIMHVGYSRGNFCTLPFPDVCHLSLADNVALLYS